MKRIRFVALALTAALALAGMGACKFVNNGSETPAAASPTSINETVMPTAESPLPTEALSEVPLTDTPVTAGTETDAPESDEPTDGPTEEPTPAPSAIPNDGCLRWRIDLDGDGESEYFVVDLNEYLIAAGSGYETRSTCPYVEKNGVNIGSLGEISTAHVSLNTFALTNVNGRDYLLEYSPYSGSGIHAFNYTLWCIEDGKLKAAETRGAELFISPGRPAEYNDVDEALAFCASAQRVWENGRLIISSDWMNVLSFGVCTAADGKRIKETAFNGTLFSTYELITPVDEEKYRSAAIFYNEALSYREEMAALDNAFTGREGYSKDMDLRDKLEYSNFVIAEDRAAIIASQELGIVGADGWTYEVIERSRDEAGNTHFVLRFPSNLFEDAEPRYVIIDNEVIKGISHTAP